VDYATFLSAYFSGICFPFSSTMTVFHEVWFGDGNPRSGSSREPWSRSDLIKVSRSFPLFYNHPPVTKRYLPKEFVTEDILNHDWYIFGMGMGRMILCSFYGITHSSYLGPVLVLEDYVKTCWYYIVIYLRLEAIVTRFL